MVAPQAELMIWTDVDPDHEADFNAWYDREHMQERLAIPGFLSGQRWRAGGKDRRYLALYRTESLAVFDSAVYRAALGSQTAWSRACFRRMRRPLRLVGEVRAAGAGRGGFAALAAGRGVATARLAAALKAASTGKGVVAAHLLTADAVRSTPVEGGAVTPQDPDAVLFVEGVAAEPVLAAASHAAAAAGLEAPVPFTLIWELRAGDLAPAAA